MGSGQAARPHAVALFVSDVHLHESLPNTTAAFFRFLDQAAAHAERLYLLGDLFEYWAGDDDLNTGYHRQVIDALRAVSERGVSIYWIAGNRDFLVGEGLAAAIGMTMLTDPHIVELAGHRIVLAHGDAQCTDDTAYMAFRAQVRDLRWQQTFLAQPLAQRKAIIEGMRAQSRQAQSGKSYEIMDVNAGAIAELFRASGADIMIHGHTHRPARHETRIGERTLVRHVLPDWDCDTDAVRGGWITLTDDGRFTRMNVEGQPVPLP